MDPRFKSLAVQVWAKGIAVCKKELDMNKWRACSFGVLLILVILTLYFPVNFRQASISCWQECPKLTQLLRPKQTRWQNPNQTHRCVQCHHCTKELFAQQFAPTVSGKPCSKINEVHTKICSDFGMKLKLKPSVLVDAKLSFRCGCLQKFRLFFLLCEGFSTSYCPLRTALSRLLVVSTYFKSVLCASKWVEASQVLMITHKRAEYLKRSLTSLFRHRTRPETYPIIASQDIFPSNDQWFRACFAGPFLMSF